MAESRKAASSTQAKDRSGNGTRKSAKAEDAISMLKQDHREVEQLFESYKKATREQEKTKLAEQICQELVIHTMLEEEIFYPACRQQDVDDEMLDEAQVEHDGAKTLINEISAGSPSDEYYDAKVSVLSEMIKHHVHEEEMRGGLFTKAKSAGIDLEEIGARMSERKAALKADAEAGALPKPELRSITHMAAE